MWTKLVAVKMVKYPQQSFYHWQQNRHYLILTHSVGTFFSQKLCKY